MIMDLVTRITLVNTELPWAGYRMEDFNMEE